MSAVSRATNLICNTLGSLPWRLQAGGRDPSTSTYSLPPPQWVTDPMLLRLDGRAGGSPAPAARRLSVSNFWSSWVRSALLRGMGYLIFEVGGEGQPVAGTLRLLHPDMVGTVDEPYLHRRIGDPGAGVETDRDGLFMVGGRVYRLVELRNPLSPVDESGLAQGVLEMHAAEYGVARQQVEYGSGMYRSGVPAGYLKVSTPNFNKEQAEKLKARWLEAHGGDRKSIAVLNATTDFQPISLSPVDMALIESRKMTLVDIANMFSIPVYHLNGGYSDGLTYSNAESRSSDLVTYAFLPWAAAIESVITSLLPQGQFLEIVFSGLLRADTKTRYEAYSAALRDGWMTVNEVRLLESLPPLAEGGTGQPFYPMDPLAPFAPAADEALTPEGTDR